MILLEQSDAAAIRSVTTLLERVCGLRVRDATFSFSAGVTPYSRATRPPPC